MRRRQWVNPAFEKDPQVIRLLELLPDGFDSSGDLLWDGRNKIRAISGMVVKRFKHPNLAQQVGYWFRSYKARRAFANGMELVKRGFDTPTPIAAIELRSGLLLKEGFYICRPLNAQAESIEPRIDCDDWDHALAQSFAHFAAELHSAGVLHNDLNDTNVFYELLSDGSYHFSVIDINRMKFYAPGQEIPTWEWIENLTRFTKRMDLYEYVIRYYLRERGIDEEQIIGQCLAQKRSHDLKRYRRKRILHLFKKKKK